MAGDVPRNRQPSNMNNTNTISLWLTGIIKSKLPCYPSMSERSELRRIQRNLDFIIAASDKQDAQISVGMVDGHG